MVRIGAALFLPYGDGREVNWGRKFWKNIMICTQRELKPTFAEIIRRLNIPV